MKGIISIQSHVVYGHAGNSAAVFPMQRLGHEVFPIHTVQFSNHTQYPDGWTGEAFSADMITDLADGLRNIKVNYDVNAVVTGYLGHPSQGEAVKHLLNHTSGIYVCDPVMPDPSKGCKMADGMPEMWKDIIELADVLIPNQYELEQLTGCAVTDVVSCIEAVNTLKAACSMGAGPAPVVLVKHLQLNDGMFTMLLSDGTGDYLAQRPCLEFDKAPVGVGDLITACFTANYLDFDHDARLAFQLTHNAVADVVKATHDAGEYELQIVAAQDQIAMPKSTYTVTKL